MVEWSVFRLIPHTNLSQKTIYLSKGASYTSKNLFEVHLDIFENVTY